jgi:hypothetical protein
MDVPALSARLQLRTRLAHERHQLTLLRSPARTLYYFAKFLAHGTSRGLQVFLSHSITLYILIPTLALYLGIKHTGMLQQEVQNLEVSTCRTVMFGTAVSGRGGQLY